MAEHLTAGEFERWASTDQEWKGRIDDRMVEHGERIKRLEVIETHLSGAVSAAVKAETEAARTRKWAIVGGTAAAIVNGVLVALGWTHGQ